MNRQRAMLDVLAALRDPRSLARLDQVRATNAIATARAAQLLARIAARVKRRALEPELPDRINGLLDAALTAAEAFHRLARFETDRIRRALSPLGTPIILLKGSAYVLAELPPAAGRSISDVDILLPRETVQDAERLLLTSGWAQIKTDDYDQRYFREWMHELPPLRHEERNTIVDLHHTILPLTGRLRPDPQLLMESSVAIDHWPGIRMLAPADMVLHNVVHHFQDGEFKHSLRELVDIDDLLRHFAEVDGFWPTLLERTERHGFGRPTFYALRYAARFLETPVPDDVMRAMRRHAPPAPVLAAMDRFVSSCLLASGRLPRGVGERLASRALYARAQWLKMPPSLLARHTLSKLFKGFGARTASVPPGKPPTESGNRSTA